MQDNRVRLRDRAPGLMWHPSRADWLGQERVLSHNKLSQMHLHHGLPEHRVEDEKQDRHEKQSVCL